VRDKANASLLDSYQSEREPHVRVFVEHAVRLGSIIQTTDAAVAAERDRRFLKGGKEEMVNLSPPLGAGAHLAHEQAQALAGTIFPQPVLADGRRLDEAIGGYRFALLAPQKFSLPRIEKDIAVVPFDGDEAILLRPDRYVHGVARNAAELIVLLRGASLESRTPEPHH
jgi:3-(3-hydroxy-phenyl)propionate hydroxylase